MVHPRSVLALCAAVVLTLAASGSALAARNPAGTGQPGAECGEEGATVEPHGFLTAGFANAEEHYAGSDGSASLAHSHSAHAVSQYDIACVHFTAAHR